jgi:hypothetical protein
MIVVGLAFLFIGLGVANSGDRPAVTAVMIGTGGVLAICGYYSASILVDSDRVVLFGFGRRRTVKLTEIRSAELRVGTTGWGASNRAFLALNLSDGRTVNFKELNSRRPCHEGTASVVDDAVAYINARLGSDSDGSAGH